MTKKELLRLLSHVGCGDLDNYSRCSTCAKIRNILNEYAEWVGPDKNENETK